MRFNIIAVPVLASVLFSFSIFINQTLAAQVGNPYRAKAELLRNKGYELKYNLRYFSQSARFDMDGNELENTDENTFSLMDHDFEVSYGLGNSLELKGLFRARAVSGTKLVNNETVEASEMGPESLGGEILYSFKPIKNWKYGVSLFYRQTLYTVEKGLPGSFTDKTVLTLGDDGSEYGGGFFFSNGSKDWIMDGELQAVSPANNLSREVRYRLGVNYKTISWAFISGIEGVYAIGDDEFTDSPTTKPISAASNYTSLFDSINRQYVKPYIGINYAFKSFMVGLRGQTTMNPVSTDSGTEVLFNISTQSMGETAEKLKVERFKDYIIDGAVLKVSGRGNFIKIDQGLQSDVEKGKTFDIYQTDYFGGNELVAEGVVYEVGSDWSIIKLTKKYKNIEIRPGFSARGE